MGIDNFHIETRHIAEKIHISKWAGHRVAADASAWIHRGAIPHAWKLFHGYGTAAAWEQDGKRPPWVTFPVNMINMLRQHNVEPVIVFDGRKNPAKAPTDKDRRIRKETAVQDAQALEVVGDRFKAERKLMQAVNVTPEMCYDLIQAIKSMDVEFVVAPYEADSQLAYLSKLPVSQGGVSAVITEDSDLVALGCPKTLFKIDAEGYAQELCLEKLFKLDPSYCVESDSAVLSATIKEPEIDKMNDCSSQTCASSATSSTSYKAESRAKSKSLLYFKGWNQDMLRAACILAGCDFVRSLPGISFRTAHKWIEKSKHYKPWTLPTLLDFMFSESKRWSRINQNEYIRDVLRAEAAFKYPLVYDVMNRSETRMMPLKDLTILNQESPYLGKKFESDLMAHQFAHGYLHFRTLKPFDCRHLPPPPDYVWAIRLPNLSSKHMSDNKRNKVDEKSSWWKANSVKQTNSSGFNFKATNSVFVNRTDSSVNGAMDSLYKNIAKQSIQNISVENRESIQIDSEVVFQEHKALTKTSLSRSEHVNPFAIVCMEEAKNCRSSVGEHRQNEIQIKKNSPRASVVQPTCISVSKDKAAENGGMQCGKGAYEKKLGPILEEHIQKKLYNNQEKKFSIQERFNILKTKMNRKMNESRSSAITLSKVSSLEKKTRPSDLLLQRRDNRKRRQSSNLFAAASNCAKINSYFNIE